MLHCGLRCHASGRPCHFANGRISAMRRTVVSGLRSIVARYVRHLRFAALIGVSICSRWTWHHTSNAGLGGTRLGNWLRNFRRIATGTHPGIAALILRLLRRTWHHASDARFGWTCTGNGFRSSSFWFVATRPHRGVGGFFLILLRRTRDDSPWGTRCGIVDCAFGSRAISDAALRWSVFGRAASRRGNFRDDGTCNRSRRWNDSRSISIDAQPALARRLQLHPVFQVRAVQAPRIFFRNRDDRFRHRT